MTDVDRSSLEDELHQRLDESNAKRAWAIVARRIPLILQRERENSEARLRLEAELAGMRAELEEARRYAWLTREDAEELADLAWSHMSIDSSADLNLRARVRQAIEKLDAS